MMRFWTFSMVVFLTMVAGLTQAGDKEKGKDFKVQGKLTKDDFKDPQRGGASQTHVVPLKAGKVYTIDMVSTQFDSYLRLLDSKDTQLGEDDDSGGDLNAQIVFACSKDGNYKIVCTTFGPDGLGDYTLTVKANGAAAQPSTAHAKLIGDTAPDFKGDFAVNGKPAKLSALEAKVVVLDFCDVRSSQCIALQAKLGEWHKAYKAKGLTVVSVAFYPSDIGQALEFNKETGGVTTVKKSDRKSDRALFGAFAAHHKIAHLLMLLPKQDALDAYNAYYVNGVPQLVLIDRKGMVRLIDVGGEKSSATVEAEIKKLIAEK